MISYVAYIDESGDEGMMLDSGSSKWFVLSAIVLRKEDDLAVCSLIDEVREKINLNRANRPHIPHRRPLHFRDLRHEQRKYYASKIGSANLAITSVCLHKKSLQRSQGNGGLYFFCLLELIQSLRLYCAFKSREMLAEESSLELILSNRSALSYDRLESDLPRELFTATESGCSVSGLLLLSHGKRMGLHIADAVATGTYLALEPNAFGQTETAYLHAMKDRLLGREDLPRNHGLIILPSEAAEEVRRGELLLPLA